MDRRLWLGLGLAALAAGHAWAGPRIPATGSLEGVWTLGSYTDFERPKDIQNLVMTATEAAAYEAARRALNGMLPSKAGEVGQPESEFNERGTGLARVRGQFRSSWITDPPDGRIPYTAEAKTRLGIEPRRPESFDGPEVRPSPERCLGSASAGAPMVGAPDSNLVQIVQTPDAVAFVTEKYHDVRIVRVKPPPALAPPPASWLGESRGHWEGATLVVETDGLRPGLTRRGMGINQSDSTRVVERFTRLSPGEILYEFRVEDPTLFTQAWRGETTLTPAPGRPFEYACHEGNYGLPDILAIARQEEARKAADTAAPAAAGQR